MSAEAGMSDQTVEKMVKRMRKNAKFAKYVLSAPERHAKHGAKPADFILNVIQEYNNQLSQEGTRG